MPRRVLSAEEVEQHKQQALECGLAAKRLIDEIDTSQRINFRKGKESGNLLLRARAEVWLIAPGTWEDWLYENFQLSPQTARKYIRYATSHPTATTFEEFKAAEERESRTPSRPVGITPADSLRIDQGQRPWHRPRPSHRRLTRTPGLSLVRDLAHEIMAYIRDTFAECGEEHDEYDTYRHLDDSDVWRMLRHIIKPIVKSHTREHLVPYCRERRAEVAQYHRRTNGPDEPQQPADDQSRPADDEQVSPDQQPQPEQPAERSEQPQRPSLRKRVQAAGRRRIDSAGAQAPPDQPLPEQPQPDQPQPETDQPVRVSPPRRRMTTVKNDANGDSRNAT